MEKKSGSFLSNVLHGAGKRARKLVSADNNIGLTRYKAWKLKHLPYNSPHVFHLNGKTIHFHNGPELLHSLREIFVDEAYKADFKTPNPYIIDCGSNIGLAVLYLTSKYPDAQVVAFEPDDTNFSYLQKNIRDNNLVNVELRKEAVWKEDTTLQFASEGTLGSKISHEGVPGGQGKDTIVVKAMRLKNLLNRPIDFLKLDIEGAEYEVVKDCADRLHLVEFLFVEFHGYFSKTHELTEILQIGEANGFAYYIREAAAVYPTPFSRKGPIYHYDLQLNIFFFKDRS
jgi:FkbM family methyltransferase